MFGMNDRPRKRRDLASLTITVFTLALTTWAVACGSDDEAASPAFIPEFTATTCPVEVDDPTITCGLVRVPENRALPNGNRVDIAVARLPALATPVDDTPVLVIAGGPGLPNLPSLAGFSRSALRDERELILFDARGTGFSIPSLECPEREEATWFNFSRSASAEDEIRTIVSATVDCADRLRAEGIDLGSYDTVANAADVADLRVALGIDEWHLLGGSYGTTVALEVMRSHPEGVRSAILDATYPLDRGRTTDRVVETGTRAFDELIEWCESNPDCTEQVGDLRSLIDRTVQDYYDDPYQTEIFDERNDTVRPLVIDGADLLAGLFTSLYDSTLIPALPSLMLAVAERNGAIIDEVARLGINRINELSEGVFAAVECRDRGSEWRIDDILTFLEQAPRFSTIFNSSTPAAACEELALGSIDSRLIDPVVSAIPTIVFGGGFDPITPPEWGIATANQLTNATSVVFADAGHGAVDFDQCSFEMALRFLQHPEQTPDTSCASGE